MYEYKIWKICKTGKLFYYGLEEANVTSLGPSAGNNFILVKFLNSRKLLGQYINICRSIAARDDTNVSEWTLNC